MQPKKIALLGTHGIPARHGAFEQAIVKICEVARDKNLNYLFLVGCSNEMRSLSLNENNIKRIFCKRPKGIGVLYYDFITSIKAYTQGSRTFIYFGYEFAPFFFLLKILGVKVICNVDGIEWRRQKWGVIPKTYFRCCEWLAARTASVLVFDAFGIARYYGINHGAHGHLIFYGSDPLPDIEQIPEFVPNTYFTVVMRMEPENNIKMIIDGFQKANTSKNLLLIGPSTPFFENNCLKFIDGVKIKYIGPIYDRERLTQIRRNSYGYIHGHSVGGTNPTLIEAIGLGNRVVAYNSIFNREVCGKNAVYFNNADDLAKAIEKDNLYVPPILNDDYNWESVAVSYFNLL